MSRPRPLTTAEKRRRQAKAPTLSDLPQPILQTILSHLTVPPLQTQHLYGTYCPSHPPQNALRSLHHHSYDTGALHPSATPRIHTAIPLPLLPIAMTSRAMAAAVATSLSIATLSYPQISSHPVTSLIVSSALLTAFSLPGDCACRLQYLHDTRYLPVLKSLTVIRAPSLKVLDLSPVIAFRYFERLCGEQSCILDLFRNLAPALRRLTIAAHNCFLNALRVVDMRHLSDLAIVDGGHGTERRAVNLPPLLASLACSSFRPQLSVLRLRDLQKSPVLSSMYAARRLRIMLSTVSELHLSYIAAGRPTITPFVAHFPNVRSLFMTGVMADDDAESLRSSCPLLANVHFTHVFFEARTSCYESIHQSFITFPPLPSVCNALRKSAISVTVAANVTGGSNLPALISDSISLTELAVKMSPRSIKHLEEICLANPNITRLSITLTRSQRPMEPIWSTITNCVTILPSLSEMKVTTLRQTPPPSVHDATTWLLSCIEAFSNPSLLEFQFPCLVNDSSKCITDILNAHIKCLHAVKMHKSLSDFSVQFLHTSELRAIQRTLQSRSVQSGCKRLQKALDESSLSSAGLSGKIAQEYLARCERIAHELRHGSIHGSSSREG